MEINSFIIKDRNIMDSIFTACEIVEDYRQNKEKGLLLKLDIEKAYDYADWDLTILWHEKILA